MLCFAAGGLRRQGRWRASVLLLIGEIMLRFRLL